MATTESEHYLLGESFLSIKELHQLSAEHKKVQLSSTASHKIESAREYLTEKVARSNQPIYGINTGFGSLYNFSIEKQELAQLQTNLVRSHACGTGEPVPRYISKLMLLLKAQSLALGHSGVRVVLVERLLEMYNRDIIPVVYQQGSLGASGDLAPLAHLSLPIMGEGEVHDASGGVKNAAEVLREHHLEPISLQFKEGLALLNGTQFMLAYGAYLSFEMRKWLYLADMIGTLSLEAYDGRPEPFDHKLMQVRPHAGQEETAANIREILQGSALINRPKEHVQDPYSLRCMPQVHGASRDMLRYVFSTFTTELNSVTDNPTVFPHEDEVLSGGNFHGQPLSLALDSLAIATAELANISERRTYLLVGGQRGLPAFLVARPGLNSGLMIAQYTAASIVSQNKQYCTPASIDSITSSNGQEDHVSMGANAATKAFKVVENLKTVLSIELLAASQAMAFRDDATSPVLQALLQGFRQNVPFIKEDRKLYKDIEKSRQFLENLQPDWELMYKNAEN